MKKAILFLGGSKYIVPLIKILQGKDFLIITCDYLPSNPAHIVSDVYWNISILDTNSILKKTKDYNIVLVSSFACDPGVISAAQISVQLGLKSPPLESIKVLQDKVRFRDLLNRIKLNTPAHYSGNDQISNNKLDFPFIIKPTDSAGSKGVEIVKNEQDFLLAKKQAIKCSLSGNYIIEDLISSQWDPIDTDFVITQGILLHLNNLNHLFL